jgi:DNA (cytosine-5)-methyltransferase 1
MNYYNEFDPYAAEWLRNLIKAGHIPNGEVDVRSIVDVQPDDLRGFTQCHFFAGIAGWSHALRLAGWDDEREIWTGSCPCQPFSVAGKGKGTADERHLWPHFHRLIAARRPKVVVGEQVSGKAGYGWLDGVRLDLEGEGYACEGFDIPACAVNAPHIRQRLYWVAHASNFRTRSFAGQASDSGRGAVDIGTESLRHADGTRGSGWADARNTGNMVNPDRAGQLEQRRAFPISQEQSGAERAGSGGSSGGQGLGRDSGGSDMAHPDSQRPQGFRPDSDTSGRRGQDISASGLCGRAGDGDMADTGHRTGRDCGELRRQSATHEDATPKKIRDGVEWSASYSGAEDDMADATGEQEHQEQQRPPADEGEWRPDGVGGCGMDYRQAGPWDDAEWLTGADGKTRRAKPGVRLLAHGVPARVGRLRAYGNAIVPPLAAEVIKSFMGTANG